MSSDSKILESIFREKYSRLDRSPFWSATLVTSAILAGAHSSEGSFEIIAAWLTDLLAPLSSHLSLVAFGAALLAAIFLPGLVRLLKRFRTLIRSHEILVVPLTIFVAILFGFHRETLQAGFWILAPFVWLSVYALRFEPASKTRIGTSDGLHRRYFVERLAEVLCEKDTAPSRVAVLGPWGSGKSTVLELLWDELEKKLPKRFHLAWVNPWRAKTPEEAWAILAAGFDTALGRKPCFPRRWADHPILAWLLSLLPGSNVTPDLVRYFSGYSGGRSDDSEVERIDAVIRDHLGDDGSKVLILVDDMERAEPAVVRSLLPIIDGLDRFKNCNFVFAIDPDRIAKAFNEATSNEALTKGYLDKVFDLKVSLPDPRIVDVGNLLEQKASNGLTPFLAAALPTLKSLLPANPRLALRFLESARARERMFFHRLEPGEVAAIPFFACWLIENEFPGFVDEVVVPERLELFDQLATNGLLGTEKRPREQPQFDELIHSLLGALKIKSKSAAENRLKTLVDFIASQAGGSLNWLSGASAKFSLEWIARGHTQLETLSIKELETLKAKWISGTGTMPIAQMIEEALHGADYCDSGICGEQLIQSELEEIVEGCKRSLQQPQSADAFVGVAERIRRLRKHFYYAQTDLGKTDLTKFGTEFFYRWLQFFASVQWENQSHPLISEIEAERVQFHLEVAQNLSIADALLALNWRIRNEIDRPGNREHEQALHGHVKALTERLTHGVHQGVLDMFRDGTLTQPWAAQNLPFESINFFLQPNNWLWLEDENWKKSLSALEAEATSNQNIAAACSLIAGHLFIHPAACTQCHGEHVNERDVIARLGTTLPEYLRFFWQSALKLDSESRDYQRLIHERKAAGSRNLVSREFLDSHFPLPA